MNSAGDEFLSRSGLTGNKYRGIDRGHFLHLHQYAPERFGRTDDLLEHRRSIDLFAQGQILLPEPLFRLLAFFNVGGRRVPANNAPLFITQRIVPDQKPSILSVLSSRPYFHVKRDATRERALAIVSHSFDIFRMKDPLVK